MNALQWIRLRRRARKISRVAGRDARAAFLRAARRCRTQGHAAPVPDRDRLRCRRCFEELYRHDEEGDG